jgi:hypothetical protein
MRRSAVTRKLLALVALGALLGGFGIATAQTGADGLAPPVEMSAQKEANLTPEEQLDQGKGHMRNIERAAAVIRRQLSEARQSRDVVKVLCLNDKLNQVDVAMRSAQDRLELLKAAVSRGDATGSRHEFTVMSVLNDRVRALVAEANQCIGEETGFAGDAVVTVEVDPSIPNADPVFNSPSGDFSPTGLGGVVPGGDQTGVGIVPPNPPPVDVSPTGE